MTDSPFDSEERTPVGDGLSSNEANVILSRYDIGTISSIRSYPKGSSRAPKAKIESDQGVFLLKRRAPGRDDPRRIRFEHAVHEKLMTTEYPVAEIMRSRRSSSTAIRDVQGIYELFRFIEAQRCQGSSAELEACGRSLAIFHEVLMEFEYSIPAIRGFHAVSNLDSHIDKYSKQLSRKNRLACQDISECYGRAAQSVESLGWSKWSTTIVHGDWHPGNVLFGEQSDVRVVLDFDNVRREPRIVDIAYGILNFGRHVAGLHKPDRSIWPVELHESSIRSFARGYASASTVPLSATELGALPGLMTEAIAMETIPSLLREGSFGGHSVTEFLPLVMDSIKRMLSNSGHLILSLQTILG